MLCVFMNEFLKWGCERKLKVLFEDAEERSFWYNHISCHDVLWINRIPTSSYCYWISTAGVLTLPMSTYTLSIIYREQVNIFDIFWDRIRLKIYLVLLHLCNAVTVIQFSSMTQFIVTKMHNMFLGHICMCKILKNVCLC